MIVSHLQSTHEPPQHRVLIGMPGEALAHLLDGKIEIALGMSNMEIPDDLLAKDLVLMLVGGVDDEAIIEQLKSQLKATPKVTTLDGCLNPDCGCHEQ